MADEKMQGGCGCGAGSSCCGAAPVPVTPEPKASCCGGADPADTKVKQEPCCGGDAKTDIREAACCDPAAGSPDVSKIRKVGFVLLLLFAGVVLIHGLLTKDTDKGVDGKAVAEEVRD